MLLIRPFDEQFGGIFARVKRHIDIVDRTAIATELARAAQYRAGEHPTSLEIISKANIATRQPKARSAALAQTPER